MLEQSISTPEICGSNPNIGKFYLPIVHLNRKDENKEKEAGNGPSLKKIGTLPQTLSIYCTDLAQILRKRCVCVLFAI